MRAKTPRPYSALQLHRERRLEPAISLETHGQVVVCALAHLALGPVPLDPQDLLWQVLAYRPRDRLAIVAIRRDCLFAVPRPRLPDISAWIISPVVPAGRDARTHPLPPRHPRKSASTFSLHLSRCCRSYASSHPSLLLVGNAPAGDSKRSNFAFEPLGASVVCVMLEFMVPWLLLYAVVSRSWDAWGVSPLCELDVGARG
jgi:hypothetical protein